MVNTLIEQFVEELKKEKVYQDYIHAKECLNQYTSLLLSYKETKEEYIKMKPYFKYQDFSELKEKFHYLSNQVTELEAYQTYMKASHQLKARLDELTSMIFDGLIVELEETTCVSSQENTNEEI